MRLFLSYATADAERVNALQSDLEKLGHEVWRDAKILGGQDWWDRICHELRSCDAVVFALSPSSTASRYCNTELQYAADLDRPLVPVMLIDTPLAAGSIPPPVQKTNVVHFEKPNHEAIIALVASLSPELAGRSLPTELPPQPAAPLGDLPALRTRITAANLSPEEQKELLPALREACDGGDEVALELVRLMRGRSNLLETVAAELDEMLRQTRVSLAPGSEARRLVKAIVTQADQGVATPILGSGLTDSLIGSRRSMARAFAEEFDFPLSEHLREDLPQVTQFVKVTQGAFTLRDRLTSHLDKQLRGSLGDGVIDAAMRLDDVLATAWDARDPGSADPHEMLASLPCPIYVTAHPAQLLEHALRAANKRPVTDVCRWRLDDSRDDWPQSPFDSTDGTTFRPTVAEPLVFHVFGLLAWPDTLVLTEDDYFKFLIGVTSERDTRVPAVVRSALADSALLVLGFQLEDWDFRTLWQALVNQEGNSRLRRYKHIAAQLDPAGSGVSPTAAREYLAEYFGRESTPALDLFWGSVADFTSAVYLERTPTA